MRGSLRAPTFAVVLAVAFLVAAGSALAATLFGTSGNDNLTGTAEGDFICGFEGDDVINGGDGVDRLYGDGVLGQGAAGPYCDRGQEGGPGHDTLYSGPGSQTQPSDLVGGPGNDLLVGGPGFDIAAGSAGNDRLRDASGSPGPYRDYLVGQDGSDTITGSPHGDVISGGEGSNVLRGGAGNDDLFAEEKSKYFAGAGDDFVGSRNNVRERVDCGRGRDKVHADKRDRLIRCERRVGRKAGPLGPAKERPPFGKSLGGGGGGGGGR
jgi:Ca2+-binding RTX toxin-like protein